MDIKIPNRHLRRIRKLPPKIQSKIFENLEELKENPFNPILDIDPLKGKYKSFYRLRIGEMRIIYYIEEGDIVVSAFDFRGDIYKKN